MLRIIQNRSAASAQSYYSKADYYSEGQELVGQWGGLGAELLGLTGEIKQHDFEAICQNRHPATGERLTPRTKSERTVGYDFNFHVPKGVSLAYMLGGDERILEAFRASVRETMQELEADVKTRIRVRGRDDERVTGNLAWGEFIHLTARPVDGVPDPHLHAHCFVANLTFDSEERRWKAAQFRDIKRDAPYFQAAFYARLGKRLTEMGYPIARSGKGWDLAEIPKSASKKFSRRTEQVEAHAEQKGVRNAREKDKLGAKTREKKQKELSLPELREIWKERLSDEERDAISVGLVPRAGIAPSKDGPTRAMRHAVEHSFERNSVVPSRELLAEALRYGIGDVGVTDVKSQLTEQDVIVRTWSGREMATTPAVLKEEQALLTYARSRRNKVQPLNASWQIRRERLNAGQREAVIHVATSRDGITMIKGMAGTGKTTLMQEAVEAIEAGGHQVFTFAPSTEASRNVLRTEGFQNATTVAELLVNERLQESARGQVLWIDEAGLLGTRQLKQVFDVAERIGTRVILSGDWRQHGSVERGAAMRLLEQEGGIKPATVSAIQRQQGRYREAVSSLAKGDTERGFDLLDELGWVQAIDDESRPRAVARAFADTLAADGCEPLVVSPTHAEGERTHQAIRSELKSRQILAADDVLFPRLTRLNLTDAERADSAMYESGDIIVFQQNVPGRVKGERLVVTDTPSAEILKYARRFQVYRLSEMPLAKGERIRFTANGQTKDGKHRINNGAMYSVAGFTKGGDIRLANGWTIAKDHGFIAPGYVVTSHAAQGKTFDKVIVVESSDSLAAASREQFYVSVSRGRHQAMIFTDDKQALRRAVTRSDPRLAATELMTAEGLPSGEMRRALAQVFDARTREGQQSPLRREASHDR